MKNLVNICILIAIIILVMFVNRKFFPNTEIQEVIKVDTCFINQNNVKHYAPTGSKARIGSRQAKVNRLWVQNCANHILADTNHKDNTLNLFF